MPKYAVLSDIHANADAFEAVLAKCSDVGVDHYLFLGDLVGYNAEPKRCLDMARELDFLAAVRGNHDEYTISGNTELAGFNANASLAIQWTRHQLDDDDLDFLMSTLDFINYDCGWRRISGKHLDKPFEINDLRSILSKA